MVRGVPGSKWTNPEGEEADLYSFAAITDECEAEMAAAGNDRMIVNLKPEYVDVQLNPQPTTEQVLRDFQ
jgi:putative SOS response-associated peptidase YedK